LVIDQPPGVRIEHLDRAAVAILMVRIALAGSQ
jgi:hypothetical protein